MVQFSGAGIAVGGALWHSTDRKSKFSVAISSFFVLMATRSPSAKLNAPDWLDWLLWRTLQSESI